MALNEEVDRLRHLVQAAQEDGSEFIDLEVSHAEAICAGFEEWRAEMGRLYARGRAMQDNLRAATQGLTGGGY
ncbi:MAG TPA: hypothetical protein VD926_00850 [Acidimicrobiales bacterium]|nr:hypothetical protein [Acidimicrobiales bacterium]